MELSKDHQAPATLPGLCYVQTARQPTHADKDHAIVSQQLLQRHQPGIHHAEPLIVTGQVLALFAHYFSQPFLDVGIFVGKSFCPEFSVRLQLINFPYPKFAAFNIGTSPQRVFDLSL